MPLEVNCPGCGTTVEWRQDNPNRPFCSEQCKNQDFVAWAQEEHQIPGEGESSDVFSEDLELYRGS